MDCTDLLRDTEKMLATLRDMEEYEPENFLKSGVTRCGHCNASGLSGGIDINRPCKFCLGVGYKGLKEFRGENICPVCNGSGFKLIYQNDVTNCDICGGGGRIDWVTAIRKGVDINKIW